MEGARLLVVDDDPALLKALTKALRLRLPELTVDSVDSGQDALACLAKAEYDAVVTDIKMPGMDGLTLLAKIRDRFPDVPALLITGHGQHDLAVQALRGGAFDFIQKPIDRDYFTASLTRALRVRQLARQDEAQKEALQQHADYLEQIVEERTLELREANQTKDRFLATLGHELRNPLASIRSAVELMARCDSQDSARDEAQQTVERQVKHMARLLDDLLDVSRITQDRIVLRTQPLNVADVVRGAVQAARPMIEEHRHELFVSLPEDMLPVEGDPTRLEQVFRNLLNNAVKYTEPGGRIWLEVDREVVRTTRRAPTGPQAGWSCPGGAPPDSAFNVADSLRESDKALAERVPHNPVARSGDRATTWVVLRVRDDGIGIPADMLDCLFEPFRQGDHPLGWEQGGLGIGLTLVRKLVELHGGTVHAESEGTGRGSEFIVRLPLADTALALIPSSPHHGQFASERDEGMRETGDEGTAESPQARILLVEDDPDLAKLTEKLLERCGCHIVEVVRDGPSAIDAVRISRPEIALVDLGLPGMSGYDLARQLREQPHLNHLTLVALTGYGQEEDRRRSLEAGFDEHLVKPVSVETLQQLLARYMGVAQQS